MYNSGARVYILRRLDAEISESKKTPELPIYTIEYVLPQNPEENSKWIQTFPDPEERAQLVHRISNLALLSRRKNSQARNFDFDKKKTLYFNYPLTPLL
ncbi:MAG: HNH endonuclease family protein [Candidatus Aminicenantales bacterium]